MSKQLECTEHKTKTLQQMYICLKSKPKTYKHLICLYNVELIRNLTLDYLSQTCMQSAGVVVNMSTV